MSSELKDYPFPETDFSDATRNELKEYRDFLKSCLDKLDKPTFWICLRAKDSDLPYLAIIIESSLHRNESIEKEMVSYWGVYGWLVSKLKIKQVEFYNAPFDALGGDPVCIEYKKNWIKHMIQQIDKLIESSAERRKV